MQKLQYLVLSVVMGCGLGWPTIGHADTISPADAAGLRSLNGGFSAGLVLVFTAVKPVNGILEDRTIVHFDNSMFSGTVPMTTLNIPVENIDAGDPTGIFDVYSFAGDGTVSADEWALGTLFHTFTGLEGIIQTLSVDVTALLQDSVNNNDLFLSFNFRSRADRYNMSSGGFPDVTLQTADGQTPNAPIPEPSTMLLFGSGLAGLAWWRHRKPTVK